MLIFFNFSLKNLRMENILDINDKFDFNSLSLENPMPMQGGNFFTKLNYSNKKLPLYIQLQKCNSKNGIIKNNTSKKSHIDLLFNYFDSNLLSWFESLENRCRELIFNKKDEWFNSEMELDDIESMFATTLKSYKSGKYIVLRANIPSSKNIKKEYCMIYDENEIILTSDKVTEDKELIPLISVEGIKFSSKSFQLEINIPQIMVLNLENTIKKDFMIKKKDNTLEKSEETNIDSVKSEENIQENVENVEKAENVENVENVVNRVKVVNVENVVNREKTENKETIKNLEEKKPLEEISDLDLEIDNLDEISLKDPEEIYIEIYTSAKNKAKQMKKAALEAYLHAKNIKNKYGIEENNSSEDEISNFS